MGQCANASVGPVANVPQPGLLFTRAMLPRQGAKRAKKGYSVRLKGRAIPSKSFNLTSSHGMCGISGQLNFARNKPVEPEIIRRMTRTMVHRGPDDEGYFVSGPLGLGFRRLSIIDLAGGHQPMSDSEETVWVIFNGEIYNYPELRQ